jgi:Na+-transporting NADH:ubiquinone oxidoreductase subunit C
LPVYGAGLWGPIWGYIALNDDKSTIYGVYFSHAGETPGLGAEIAAAPFQNQFTASPKQIMRNGEFTSIGVVKAGKVDENRDYVNAISGGTITSQGVEAMLFDGLSQYVNFLKQ